MSIAISCRFCFAAGNDQHLNIFSGIGIETQMSEIIREHFKCDISESDSLPNFVCQVCWTTTEAFHELYQKSKTVQEKYLSQLIKIEVDNAGFYNENDGQDYSGEPAIEINKLKAEPQPEYQDAIETMFIEQNDIVETHLEDEANLGDDSDLGTETQQSQTKRPAIEIAEDVDFEELFMKYKHRYDMSCDLCTTVFESIEECRSHYREVHSSKKANIKCCNVRQRSWAEIVRHLKRHLDSETYTCTECGEDFGGLKALAKHIKSQHPKTERLPCNICQKIFTKKDSLRNHIRVIHVKPPRQVKLESEIYKSFIAEHFDMSCDLCDVVFLTFYDARNHYDECHKEPKGYIKCCKTKLQTVFSVESHIDYHLNPDIFKCDECGKRCTSSQKFNKHKLVHRNSRKQPLTCDMCGKCFKYKQNILAHLLNVHVKSEPQFECDICHKRFQSISLLRTHKYAVHREKKLNKTCEICGKSFHVKYHLDKHMLSHADKSERLAQRQQCEYCGDWLMTKGGIYYHEQIHTSGVQQCSQCDMELPNKMALKAHIRSYHRERKFKCSFCGKAFATASVMKKHEEFHTRHNVYPCKFCPRTFTISSSLQSHTKRTHSEELKLLREAKIRNKV